MAELFDHLDDLRRSARKVAVATLVNTRGTTRRKEGAKMVVGEGGGILGSVMIGGCVDAQVLEESEDVRATMRPRLLELNLGDEDAWEIGLTCGGPIEVFVEPLALDRADDAAARLYARARRHATAGHTAALVTRLDGEVGRKLLVLDDGAVEGTLGDAFLDERFAREAREAMTTGASRTLFLEGTRAFVEVVAPPALLLVVGASHVAMPLVQLKRMRVPIGLDLGARSAPEIALAIMAEIQAARGGGSGQPLSARPHAPAAGHPRSAPALRPPVE